jgi:hypothetical protein
VERPEARRRAVLLISELFLDQDLTMRSLQRVAQLLRGLEFSLGDLDGIYLEVAAVLYRNTYAVAGVWTGFDPDWLMNEIARNAPRPKVGLLGRLRRHIVTRSTIGDWRKLRSLVESDRPPPAVPARHDSVSP